MSKQTVVVSGFPGVGKSYFVNNGDYIALDSDSSNFSWLTDEDGNKTRHPNFPTNYIEHIKSNLGKVDYILVSSHDVVRDALRENNIRYVSVFPDKSLKHDFMNRYKERNSPEPFLRLMDKQYDSFVDGLMNDTNKRRVVLQDEGLYLSDVLEEINHEYHKWQTLGELRKLETSK